MSYQLSDDDSTDSDSGIRFKTTNIRNKGGDHSAFSSNKSSSYNSSERQLKTHRHHREHRSRDRSRDRRRRSRSSEYRKRSSRDLDKSRDDRKRSERKKEKSRKTESTTRTNKEIDSVTEHSNKESKKIKDLEQKNKSSKPPKLLNKKSNDVIISDKNATKNSPERGLTGPSSLLSDKLEAISDDENICGPALPPHLLNKTAESNNSETNTYAPALPPHLLSSNNNTLSPQPILTSSDDDICGPVLPPHLTKTPLSTLETPKADEDDSLCGPALPPHVSNKSPATPQSTTPEKKVIGPTLPQHLRESLQKDAPSSAISIDPPEEGEIEEDFDMIGPLPAGLKTKNPSHTQLEERAIQIQLDRLNKPADDIKTREEWMLELPTVQAANLGLGPRQFRAKGVPDMSDRSSWTDTPEDKVKKETTKGKEIKIDIKKEAELKRIQERDREQQKQVEKHKKKKKRDKSLLDLHQDEYNKKKKKEAEESGKPERRPFNRDTDLKANRFDEAQKKSILKKAQLLDTRFSAGESKFL